MSMIQVNSWHIMMIGPLFYYIGSKGNNNTALFYNALINTYEENSINYGVPAKFIKYRD